MLGRKGTYRASSAKRDASTCPEGATRRLRRRGISAAAAHCQGQKNNAAAVSVASSELDSVRVEQNHCHGLASVMASWASLISRRSLVFRATYGSARDAAVRAVEALGEGDGVVVETRGQTCLGELWRGDEQLRLRGGRQIADICEDGGETVDGGEEQRVQRRPQLGLPFLRGMQLSAQKARETAPNALRNVDRGKKEPQPPQKK